MEFTEDDIPVGALSRYVGPVMPAINGEPALEEEFVGVVDLFWSGSATVAGVAALEMALFHPNKSPSLLLRPGKLFLQAKVDWLEWGMLRRPWLSRHIDAGLTLPIPILRQSYDLWREDRVLAHDIRVAELWELERRGWAAGYDVVHA